MEEDVQRLIEGWPRARLLMSRRRATRPSRNPELAWLVERRENWEVFVCLVGYARSTEKGLAAILSEAPNFLTRRRPNLGRQFLDYSLQFKSLSPLVRLTIAFSDLKRRFGRWALSEIPDPELERCLEESKGDPEAFLECLSGKVDSVRRSRLKVNTFEPPQAGNPPLMA